MKRKREENSTKNNCRFCFSVDVDSAIIDSVCLKIKIKKNERKRETKLKRKRKRNLFLE